MKSASRSTAAYAVALAVLALTAYFVQTDTRRVDGISMLPTLEGGDLVVIQGVPMADVHVGDIIVYNNLCSSNGESVIHRVVAVQSNGLITKGDNNRDTDQASRIALSPITANCLVGKVVFVIPYVELLAYYIDQQQLPAWFNYVPAALILIIVVYLVLGQGEPEDEEEDKAAAEAPATSG